MATEQLTVVSCAHVRNTANGNSVWRVKFSNGAEHMTKPDGSVGATLSSNWAGRRVDVEFNAGGRITSMVQV